MVIQIDRESERKRAKKKKEKVPKRWIAFMENVLKKFLRIHTMTIQEVKRSVMKILGVGD